MYKLKGNNGQYVYWFRSDWYESNSIRAKQGSWIYSCFNTYYNPNGIHWSNEDGYLLLENLDSKQYNDNFITTLPEKAVLYFDKSSNFPRAKLSTSAYKRCIKTEKATAIVLGTVAFIQNVIEEYTIFTDGVNFFALRNSDFDKCFNRKLEKIFAQQQLVGTRFAGDLKIVYSGNITLVIDPTDTLKNFNTKVYNKPFILDENLNKLVNQNLPDPTLNELTSIYEMLCSSDGSVVKLGALTASGYNVTKWLLTFRCLMGLNIDWLASWNGGNSVINKQLWETLKLKHHWGGIRTLASSIQALDEKYSKEDTKLAQDFIRKVCTEDELKKFCEKGQTFYIESLPFIPDEYKK